MDGNSVSVRVVHSFQASFSQPLEEVGAQIAAAQQAQGLKPPVCTICEQQGEERSAADGHDHDAAHHPQAGDRAGAASQAAGDLPDAAAAASGTPFGHPSASTAAAVAAALAAPAASQECLPLVRVQSTAVPEVDVDGDGGSARGQAQQELEAGLSAVWQQLPARGAAAGAGGEAAAARAPAPLQQTLPSHHHQQQQAKPEGHHRMASADQLAQELQYQVPPGGGCLCPSACLPRRASAGSPPLPALDGLCAHGAPPARIAPVSGCAALFLWVRAPLTRLSAGGAAAAGPHTQRAGRDGGGQPAGRHAGPPAPEARGLCLEAAQ